MNTTTWRTAFLAALTCVLVLASGLNATAFSAAAFTSLSQNVGSTASAAADWTPPTASIQNPGAPLKGAATITAVASDGETGIRDVAFSVQAVGSSSWTALCTATTTPYQCGWNTTAVVDGDYDVRAIATDNAGYATTSALVRVSVSNAFGVTLADPGEIVRGSVPLAATLQNANTGTYAVRIDYANAGSGNWKPLCTTLAAPFTCTWNTTVFAAGFYDLRAVATQGLSTAISPVISDVLVDNAAPAVTMNDPGAPLSGTVTLTASASDADSGVASVTIQYAPSGSSTWTTVCTATAAPYSCRLNTTTLAAGGYAMRAVAVDGAGNTTTSAVVANRQVDNTISSVSLEDPGAYLSGQATLTAAASSSAGVASVTVQYAPSGTSGWTAACTATNAPYSCVWNTTAVADGSYDLRAVLVDGAGRQTVSATVSARRVDNTPVRGLDVQTANGGATAGRLDTGDTLTFTYSKQLATGSIFAGWNGAAQGVTLRLRDGGLLGTGAAGDTVDVIVGSTAVNLGSVNLRGDYVKSGKTSTFAGTMTAATAVVGGASVTVVTVIATAPISAGALRTASVAAAMSWTPSASATDLSGIRCSTAPVSETGALDREF